MRRKLTTLAAKSGHNRNISPRQIIDETVYRSHYHSVQTFINTGDSPHWSPVFSGWSNPSRPRDFAIFLRSKTAGGEGGG